MITAITERCWIVVISSRGESGPRGYTRLMRSHTVGGATRNSGAVGGAEAMSRTSQASSTAAEAP